MNNTDTEIKVEKLKFHYSWNKNRRIIVKKRKPEEPIYVKCICGSVKYKIVEESLLNICTCKDCNKRITWLNNEELKRTINKPTL